MNPLPPLEPTDLDRRIWREELDEFVPAQVFDAHTHIYRWAFNLDPNKEQGTWRRLLGTALLNSPWPLINQVDELLMPGRKVDRLSFPFPFSHPCDFEGSNEFLARELADAPSSGGLMLVHPGMSADQVESVTERH